MSPPELGWPPDSLWTPLFVSAAVLIIVFHYPFSSHAWRVRLEARGHAPELAQAYGVMVSKISGGVILGLGSILTLWVLGKNPLDSGLMGFDVGRSAMGLAGLAAVVLPIVATSARSPKMHDQYPEIRLRAFTPRIALLSAGAWAFYLLGYEFFFRGMLLFEPARELGAWPALSIMTAIYVLQHLNKPASETFGTLPMGFAFGILALWTGGIWAPWLLHTAIAVVSETMAARSNTELDWWSQET